MKHKLSKTTQALLTDAITTATNEVFAAEYSTTAKARDAEVAHRRAMEKLTRRLLFLEGKVRLLAEIQGYASRTAQDVVLRGAP